MKSGIKYGVKAFGILCISVLLGALCLIMVFMFPTQEMKNNVQRSTAIYDYEGVYPQLMAGYKMSQLDNCTDATMLLNAIYPRGTGMKNVIENAMNVYRIEYYDRNPVGSLTDYANDVEGETYTATYSRYWHGYLVPLKILLLFFDVSDIRICNMFLQFTLLFYILYLMLQKGLKQYVPLFAAALLLLNPITIPVSFQFSAVSYIMLVSVIIVMKRKEWREWQWLFLFLMIGIATAYFDFLTFPLVGLYFPMIFLLMQETSWKKATKIVILGSIAWIIGYAGMWCGKWLIGSILTGNNIFSEAFARAGEYTNMEYDDGKVNCFQVILKNVQVLVKWPILFGGIGILVYLINNLVKAGRTHGISVLKFLPFFIIAFAPVCWYIAAGTHSYIHYWFTYRELCVSVFAALTGICKVGEDDK